MSESLTFQGLKQTPNSIEAEIAVLGGLILDNEAWEKEKVINARCLSARFRLFALMCRGHCRKRVIMKGTILITLREHRQSVLVFASTQ